ncbi:hypothetical protein TSOC_003693 [Tetrabaena socialis]|uniref:RING-type domain-containing protein n=1 Tax=Tetrabaena socialis TaxID=47790 RepID=A0A2J8AAX8_9CHLO|nr:hypothetical protein TSOC_003693 [Tetrabaena socialis]|eukprot:PNH09681.1 hypothetical protein TSOC_003693 [Tetrabaena socialis]
MEAGLSAGVGPSQGAGQEADEVVLRVLRCGHRFHVECVDKWFLSSTDYSRVPACPLCNAPLLDGHRGGAQPAQGQQRR